MKNKEKDKMYIVRKYVMAKDVASALRKEKNTKPHDVFVDEKWQDKYLADAIGFHVYPPVDED